MPLAGVRAVELIPTIARVRYYAAATDRSSQMAEACSVSRVTRSVLFQASQGMLKKRLLGSWSDLEGW